MFAQSTVPAPALGERTGLAMVIILLLVLIVFLLLGGAGLIFSLVYGLFVLAWAALPWVVLMLGIMFAASVIGIRMKEAETNRRCAKAEEKRRLEQQAEIDADRDKIEADREMQERAVVALLAKGRAEYERNFGPIKDRDARLAAAKRNRRRQRQGE